MGITLLFGKGRSELHALFGVSDHDSEGSLSCSYAKGGDHEPRMPKDHVGLF